MTTKVSIHDFIRGQRADARCDDLGDAAGAASTKAHKSDEPRDHHDAALAHARASDEHSKKGNFAQADHHRAMANFHRNEAEGPDSAEEGPPSSAADR